MESMRAMLTALREHAHAKPWAWHALRTIQANVTAHWTNRDISFLESAAPEFFLLLR
jgi:hypothetical protein